MNSAETHVFKLLDRFAKKRYQCFVSEMFPSHSDKGTYQICFRPLEASGSERRRLACQYVTISASEMAAMSEADALTPTLADRLDRELSVLTSTS